MQVPSRAIRAPLLRAFGKNIAAVTSLLACHTETFLPSGRLSSFSLVAITPRRLLLSLPKQPQTYLDPRLGICDGQQTSCL